MARIPQDKKTPKKKRKPKGTKPGRKSKISPEMTDMIVDAISRGNYIETASAYAGIHKDTLYEWLKRGAREKYRLQQDPEAKPNPDEALYVDFHTRVQKALASSEMGDLDVISAASGTQWQAAAWRLERRFPDRWGRKDHLKTDNRTKVTGQIDIDATIDGKVEQTIVADEEFIRAYYKAVKDTVDADTPSDAGQ